jgi:8-oxo-dGTP pyrophosphatase MutT (NUDIX family)
MEKTVSIIVSDNLSNILFLKNCSNKQKYANKWDIISGKIEDDETAYEAFYRELFEETGIYNTYSIQRMEPYIYDEEEQGINFNNTNNQKYLVHLFFCKTTQKNIKLSREHSEYKWCKYSDFFKMEHTFPAIYDIKKFYGLT